MDLPHVLTYTQIFGIHNILWQEVYCFSGGRIQIYSVTLCMEGNTHLCSLLLLFHF